MVSFTSRRNWSIREFYILNFVHFFVTKTTQSKNLAYDGKETGSLAERQFIAARLSDCDGRLGPLSDRSDPMLMFVPSQSEAGHNMCCLTCFNGLEGTQSGVQQ